MIAISGFFADPTGFGETARRYLCALNRVAADVMPGRILTDGGDRMAPETWPWVNLQEFVEHTGNPDVHFIIAQAAQFPQVRLKAPRQVGFTTWETNKLPQSYLSGVAGMSDVIVPCYQNYCLYYDAGYPNSRFVRIPVIGPYEWSDGWQDKLSRAGAGVGQSLGISPGTYVFYTVSTLQARKNPEGILISYLTAFSGYDDVVLVMKVSGGAADLQRAKDIHQRLLLDINLPNPPKVKFIGGAQFTEEWLWGLHERGDCYVSLSRGEACCLPLVDSYAIGTSVIAPKWGGHLSYVKVVTEPKDRYITVPGHMTPVVQRYPFFDGSQSWFEPDLCQAQDAMRLMFKEGRYAKSRRTDAELQTPEQTGAQLMEIFNGD